MNRTTVNDARDAAIRFLDRANALLKDDDFDCNDSFMERGGVFPVYPAAKAGALRRASLDLTRDLAAMRRPS